MNLVEINTHQESPGLVLGDSAYGLARSGKIQEPPEYSNAENRDNKADRSIQRDVHSRAQLNSSLPVLRNASILTSPHG